MTNASQRRILSMFFAMLGMPFIYVWFSTQFSFTYERYFPSYTVVKIGKLSEDDTGITLKDVAFRKDHDCAADGTVYLSGSYLKDLRSTPVLLSVEVPPGNDPLLVKHALAVGAEFFFPTIHIAVTKGLLADLRDFRFMFPCTRPFLGQTRAYTNPVTL
jgi:hypothetical protein